MPEPVGSQTLKRLPKHEALRIDHAQAQGCVRTVTAGLKPSFVCSFLSEARSDMQLATMTKSLILAHPHASGSMFTPALRVAKDG